MIIGGIPLIKVLTTGQRILTSVVTNAVYAVAKFNFIKSVHYFFCDTLW